MKCRLLLLLEAHFNRRPFLRPRPKRGRGGGGEGGGGGGGLGNNLVKKTTKNIGVQVLQESRIVIITAHVGLPN